MPIDNVLFILEKADEIKALGGVDFETYSAKAADGWMLTEMDEKHSDAEHDRLFSRLGVMLASEVSVHEKPPVSRA